MADKKMGRPKIDIPIDELNKLSRLHCTIDEIAAYFGCSRDTIERRMRDEEEVRIAIEQGRAQGKISLRRKQFQILDQTNNATMAIWLGKNVLGQRDMIDVITEDKNQKALSEAFSIIDELARAKRDEQ